MIYLIFSIICSLTVGVLLKLAKRYHISIVQVISWNYFFAIGFSFFFFKPVLADLQFRSFSPVHLTLGFLLPAIFIFLALSVEKTGLARTDIAQRLSLFISLTAAYFIFGDSYTPLKLCGIGLGFLAIVFTLYRQSGTAISAVNWIYPSLVFIGFGIIDICFKLVSQQSATLPYTTSLILIFCLAFIISMIYLAYLSITKRTRIQLVNFICGGVLGFFNFGNILFYLKAHQAMADSPSTVFATMNMGVIIGGSLIGILLFREKLSSWNYLGLFLALLSIILITLSQLNAVR